MFCVRCDHLFASPLSVLPTLSTTAHAIARKTSERCIPGAHFPIHTDCCGRVRQTPRRESQLCRFALDSCNGARGRKCRTVAAWRGVWPQSVSIRLHYEGREL